MQDGLPLLSLSETTGARRSCALRRAPWQSDQTPGWESRSGKPHVGGLRTLLALPKRRSRSCLKVRSSGSTAARATASSPETTARRTCSCTPTRWLPALPHCKRTWRGLWYGWASDEAIRHEGASGGLATAILAGALEEGLIDGAVVAGPSEDNALAVKPHLARSVAEIAAARGSKYNMVATNTALGTLLDEPGRYAFVGLPCHIQGLRLPAPPPAPGRARGLLTRHLLWLERPAAPPPWRPAAWDSMPPASPACATGDPAGPAACALRPTLAKCANSLPGLLRQRPRHARPHPATLPSLSRRHGGACRLSVGDAWLERFAEPGRGLRPDCPHAGRLGADRAPRGAATLLGLAKRHTACGAAPPGLALDPNRRPQPSHR